jgi:PEGA domain
MQTYVASNSYDDATQRALARQDALLAAAHAAVAWARMQSSTHARVAATARPAAIKEPEPSSFSVTPLIDAARTAGDAGMFAARGARSASRAAATAVGAVGAGIGRMTRPILRALPRVAAVAAAGGAIWFGVVKGRPYVERWKATPPIPRTVAAVTPADLAPVEATTGSKKRTGRLVVSSGSSDVAQVLVDGQVRGITPLTLDGLTAGKHVILVQNTNGSVEQTVTVAANETARLEQTIYPGWVAIVAPFDLKISEGARTLRPDDRSQVMLPPGPHNLQFENRALGYQEMRHVDVRPGETTHLSVAPAQSKATFTATAPAEVFVDGKPVGVTPLIDLPVDIGTHHVRMKSGSQERQFTITATMTPLTFNADFSQ